jgi:hypothetical protein
VRRCGWGGGCWWCGWRGPSCSSRRRSGRQSPPPSSNFGLRRRRRIRSLRSLRSLRRLRLRLRTPLPPLGGCRRRRRWQRRLRCRRGTLGLSPPHPFWTAWPRKPRHAASPRRAGRAAPPRRHNAAAPRRRAAPPPGRAAGGGCAYAVGQLGAVAAASVWSLSAGRAAPCQMARRDIE